VPVLQRWVEDELLALPQPAAPWLERALQAFEQQLAIEEQMPADAAAPDDGAGKLALARAIGHAGDGDIGGEPGLQRIVSARLEARQRRHWSPVHIRSRVEQVAEIEAQVVSARHELAAQAEALRQALASRLWWPPVLRQRTASVHEFALQSLDAQAARLAAMREGFAALPCDESAGAASPPTPVALKATA